jgi:hypothetical protein
MVLALERRYGIGKDKTFSYKWPGLEEKSIHPFLRGYIDGDGCVGIYQTPQKTSYLHISFVGVSGFIEPVLQYLPPGGRSHNLRTANRLIEVRWNGRNAWDLGQWLYSAASALPSSEKMKKFMDYAYEVKKNPPLWMQRRKEV